MKKRALWISVAGIAAVAALASAQAKTMSGMDFVRTASVAGEFEIESSQLALEKSQDSDVRHFAQHMIDDHTKLSNELKQTLQSTPMEAAVDEGLDDTHQDLLDQLRTTPEGEFDQRYIDMQTKAHKEAVGLFSDYSQHGKDRKLKQFAAQALPTLKEHLSAVRGLKE